MHPLSQINFFSLFLSFSVFSFRYPLIGSISTAYTTKQTILLSYFSGHMKTKLLQLPHTYFCFYFKILILHLTHSLRVLCMFFKEPFMLQAIITLQLFWRIQIVIKVIPQLTSRIIWIYPTPPLIQDPFPTQKPVLTSFCIE